MIQEIITFLIDNQEVLMQIVEGKANLIGVSAEEQNAIVSTLTKGGEYVINFWSSGCC